MSAGEVIFTKILVLEDESQESNLQKINGTPSIHRVQADQAEE